MHLMCYFNQNRKHIFFGITYVLFQFKITCIKPTSSLNISIYVKRYFGKVIDDIVLTILLNDSTADPK